MCGGNTGLLPAPKENSNPKAHDPILPPRAQAREIPPLLAKAGISGLCRGSGSQGFKALRELAVLDLVKGVWAIAFCEFCAEGSSAF